MSANYDPTKIATSDTTFISAVRWLIQDTNMAAAELSDEEITALFNQTSTDDTQSVRTYATALAAAQGLERRYRKQASFSSGGTSVQLGERAKAWGQMVSELAEAYNTEIAKAEGRSGGILYGGRGPMFWTDEMLFGT